MTRLDLKAPANILELVQTSSVFGTWEDLITRLNFTAQEKDVLENLISDVYERKLELKDFYPKLNSALQREEAEKKQIATEILAHNFSFIESYLKDSVAERVKEFGGDMALYNKEKSLMEELLEYDLGLLPSYEETVEEMTEEDLDEVLIVEDIDLEKEEFKKVFASYLSNILFNDDEAFKYLLNIRLIQVLLAQDIVYLNDLLQIMAQNTEVITKGKIDLGGKPVGGNIGNWIQDFILTMGAEKITTLKKAQYFSTNANVAGLTAEEKSKVNIVLETYVQLKTFPSRLQDQPAEKWIVFPVTGMEESKVRAYKEQAAMLKMGQRQVGENNIEESLPETEEVSPQESMPAKQDVEDISMSPPAVAKVANTQKKAPISLQEKAKRESKISQDEIAKKYQGDPAERKEIEQNMERLMKIIGNKSAQLNDYLFKQVNLEKASKVNVVSVLRLIAQTNNLEELLQDKRSAELIGQFLTPGDKAEFSKNPTARKSLHLFLKCLLELKLREQTSESARIGLQINNALKRQGNDQFGTMVRFNLQTGNFEWSSNI